MNPTASTPTSDSIAWHTLPVDDVFKALRTDKDKGLSDHEAARRLETHGPNRLTQKAVISPWAILAEQFKNFLVIILLVAVALSGVLGHAVEAVAIGVIVLFAVGLGFIQEYRAERALEALKKLSAPLAAVLRGGLEKEVKTEEIVPGDIVLLKTGDKIPADARVIESINMQADEATLTGESVPVEKKTEAIADPKASIGDQRSMLFAGTAVTYGRGKAAVTATAMATEFGKIAGMLQDVETEQTPLQKNLDVVGKRLAQAALVIVIVISALGWLQERPLLEIVIFGIALAVAVVPEALPAVVTISLALGVQRMAKRNALVRRLPAVETLGSTSVICTDKTGTLTKDEMTIRKILVGDKVYEVSGSGYRPEGEFSHKGKSGAPSSLIQELLKGATLSSDAVLTHEEGIFDIKGDPTEGAFVVAAAKAGLKRDDLHQSFPRIGEIPFSSETKRMTTLHKKGEETVAYAKGAAEVILDGCDRILEEDGEKPLTEHKRKEILEHAKTMASEALRVLAVARKHTPHLHEAHTGMTFLGMTGMIDPPRPEAKDAIAKCHRAGIRVVMITGDHPITAQAIARELGLLQGTGTELVVTGAELEDMDDATFDRKVESIAVFARVSPAHKLRVVGALQKKGEIVAMTGDGVNDAPALKKADIGIAMGITGTDVTKEAAAMTLTDDNFASIVAAVEEGRGIFGNIKKYLMYLLSSNIGEICLMAGSTLLGWPLPLTAVQILYVNLATDGLPALALSVDPPERDLMGRKPRDPRRSIFTRPVVLLMLCGGIWSMIVNLLLFGFSQSQGMPLEHAMTMTFVSLVLIQFFKAYSFRSDRHSALRKPFANKWLNWAVLWELVLLILIVEIPLLHIPFGTQALTPREWLLITTLAFTVIPVLEIAKWMERREWFGKLEA